MARRYTVVFEQVSVSAAQDFFEIKGASGKILRILKLKVRSAENGALPTAQTLPVRCQFFPATVTDGSGGSIPTPRRLDPGDAAASFTALCNNTTQASTNGTAVTVDEDGFHIYSGYEVVFESPPIIGPSEAFLCQLLHAPASAVVLSGTCTVEEMGG